MASSSVGEWGRVDTYNLSAEEMELVRKRADRRAALKKEYHRVLYNPFTNMKVEGGIPFDPAMQRFASTRADYFPYFRPNKKNFAFFCLIYVFPLIGSTWFMEKMRTDFDARIKNAEIPWRYRSAKVY